MLQVTTIISGEKYPTISMIAPMKHKLIQALKVPTTPPVLCTAAKEMVNDLSQRYNDPEVRNFLHEATFTDPRFKELTFLSERERRTVMTLVQDRAEDMCAECDDSDSDIQGVDEQPPTTVKKGSLLDEFFGESYASARDSNITVSSKISREIDAYSMEMSAPLNSCPIG